MATSRPWPKWLTHKPRLMPGLGCGGGLVCSLAGGFLGAAGCFGLDADLDLRLGDCGAAATIGFAGSAVVGLAAANAGGALGSRGARGALVTAVVLGASATESSAALALALGFAGFCFHVSVMTMAASKPQTTTATAAQEARFELTLGPIMRVALSPLAELANACG
jgi:hypothetical protein